MKIEKLNYIFSIIFLLFGVSCTVSLWISGETKDYEPHLYIFCCFVIVTVFFNILAYKYNQKNFYLIGATGFLALSLFHFGTLLICFKNLTLRGRYYKEEIYFFENIEFPLGLFGLFSTLFCFQQKYIETIDEKYSNKKPGWLKFCISDFTKCLAIFYVSIIFYFVFSTTYIIKNYPYEPVLFLLLVPTIVPVLNLLAIKFKSKKFCIAGLIVLGIFILFAIAFGVCLLCYLWQDYRRCHCNRVNIEGVLLSSIFILTLLNYAFIGIFGGLHLYRKYGNSSVEDEQSGKSPNFIYKTSHYLWESSKCCAAV